MECSMWHAKQLRLMFVVGVLTGLACGRPPVVYQNNAHKYSEVVAKADDLFEITMAELYDSLYHSDLQERGGILDREVISSFLDRLLCDTLTGLKAGEIDLSQYHRYYRLYKQRLSLIHI